MWPLVVAVDLKPGDTDNRVRLFLDTVVEKVSPFPVRVLLCPQFFGLASGGKGALCSRWEQLVMLSVLVRAVSTRKASRPAKRPRTHTAPTASLTPFNSAFGESVAAAVKDLVAAWDRVARTHTFIDCNGMLSDYFGFGEDGPFFDAAVKGRYSDSDVRAVCEHFVKDVSDLGAFFATATPAMISAAEWRHHILPVSLPGQDTHALRVSSAASDALRKMQDTKDQAKDSIQTNYFYLLSLYGPDVYRAPRNKPNPARYWGGDELWALASFREGFQPDELDYKDTFLRLYRDLLIAVPEKKFDLLAEVEFFEMLSDADYIDSVPQHLHSFQQERVSELQSRGICVMDSMVEGDWGGDVRMTAHVGAQGLEWNNNSCGLDAILSILPDLFYTLVTGTSCYNDTPRDMIEQLPVFGLLGAMQLGFQYLRDQDIRKENPVTLGTISDMIRMFALGLLIWFRRDVLPPEVEWSPTRKGQPFLELYDLELVFVVNTLVPRGSVAQSNMVLYQPVTVAHILDYTGPPDLSTFLRRVPKKDTMPDGLQIFVLPDFTSSCKSFTLRRKAKAIIRRFILGSWVTEDDTAIDKVVAVLGWAGSSRNHFVSGLVSGEGADRTFMVQDGMRRKAAFYWETLQDAFSDKSPTFNLDSMRIYSVHSNKDQ